MILVTLGCIVREIWWSDGPFLEKLGDNSTEKCLKTLKYDRTMFFVN